jgi:hypothetical protein
MLWIIMALDDEFLSIQSWNLPSLLDIGNVA